MGIIKSMATSSFELARNGRRVSVIYPEDLKRKILLVRPLGLSNYPGYRRAYTSEYKNWHGARAKSIYKIVSIDGLNQVYDFLEREKNVSVSESRIRIFFNGHVQKCKDFKNTFPKDGGSKVKSFLFSHHNDI